MPTPAENQPVQYPAVHNVSHVNATPFVVCYQPTMVSTNGVWQGANPLDYALPLFLFQVILVVVTTRIVVFILRPLRQPRVISEIISGIILGPSVMGRIKVLPQLMFPDRSVLTLETVANLGLVFFLFLVGVEMDINVIRRSGRKALVIAFVGMAFPFAIGTTTSFFFRHRISKNIHPGAFLLFFGVAVSVTAFPVLARILGETKLLNSELGRIAMSSAIINDMCAWILVALSIALANTRGTILATLWVLLSGVAFVFACFYIIRPIMWRVIRHIPDGEGASDFHVCSILTGAMLASFITDAIGIHSVFGAFMFGLVIPNGPLGITLIEKLEDFVNGIMLPLFFVTSGLKTDVTKFKDFGIIGLLTLIFFLASFSKIGATLIIALFYNMPISDGVALGFLMSCKGLVEMIILNVGHDKQVLDDTSFAVMVLTSLVITSLVTPVVTTITRPSRRLVGYKRRNLQRWSKPDSELRMLACVHNTRHVPTIISLLEVSNPTKRSPIFVYALHLVELTGRASVMLIANSTSSTTSKTGRGQVPTEHILAAFENYEQHAGGVSVQTLTAVSPYSTMHEDICRLAEDKHVALIVLPFHKQLTVDGGMEATNPAIHTLNEKVLDNAPCSVAILVDRGLSGAAQIAAGQILSHHIAVLFFGGPDDREALAYAWRMADHPGICLTVVRFLSPAALPPPPPPVTDSRVITIVADGASRERMQDEEYLSEFRARHMNDESVMYTVREVSSSEETVTEIRTMDCVYDLYVVGRGQGESSALTAGLSEFSECPELGPIGDLLASSDFAMTVSVLVVKQYVCPESDSPARFPAQQHLIGDQRERIMAGRVSVADTHQGWNGGY